MSSYTSFDTQKQQDASFTVKTMGIQLGINIGTAMAVIVAFSILRPKNKTVYAPKLKYSPEKNRPPEIDEKGWFAWIKTISTVSDNELLEKIGCDAVLYIRFIRMLRMLLLCMSIVGVCALIPINIVATKYTGDWPPPSGSISTLSLAGINNVNGKLRSDPVKNWYWAPFVATYLFSGLIVYFMFRASCDYIEMRQYYFRLPENQVTMKSLIVGNIPANKRTDEDLKEWFKECFMNSNRANYPVKEAMIGHHSSELSELYEKHETAVENLENTLASHLGDGKQDIDSKKRPTVKVGNILCFGGKEEDAIDYYTKQVSETEKEIEELRQDSTKVASFGWVSFEKVEWAHITAKSLSKTHVKLSPTPKNLVWGNLSLDDAMRYSKRWIGRLIYIVFLFAWMIPMSALSATSNIVNIIRLIPNSADFITNYATLIGMIQSYFTPIVMAIFFFALPYLFRFLSKQQGYWTQTTLDRKVLVKLYIFFIVNNLLVFTLTSMFIGIYGQVRALILSGTLPSDTSISEYIMEIAKNLSDVSTFWINFVCLKSLGLTMELAMLVPLVTVTAKRLFTRPSPRELREMSKPPEFDYSQSYNLLLFFFTIALVYSVMSPLILPFAYIYFCVANIVYKYLLMYIYETKIESGGKIWPVLFQTVMSSTIFFQVTMIIILVLKGGSWQVYFLIPLPVFTFLFQYFYYKRMHMLGSYVSSSFKSTVTNEPRVDDHGDTEEHSLKSEFRDPAYRHKLSKPTVHDDVKYLLPKVYKNSKVKTIKTLGRVRSYGRDAINQMDLDQNKGFNHHLQLSISRKHNKQPHRFTAIYNNNGSSSIQFESLTDKEILDKDFNLDGDGDTSDNDDNSKESETIQDKSIHSKYEANRMSDSTPLMKRFESNASSNNELSLHSLTSLNNTLMPPPLQQRKKSLDDRNITSEYIEMYSSFTPNASMQDMHQEELKWAKNPSSVFTEEISLTDLGTAGINLYGHNDQDNEKVSLEYPYDDVGSFSQSKIADEEEEDEASVHKAKTVELNRQISVPAHRSTLTNENIKRSKTLPVKSQSIRSNNPFEDFDENVADHNEDNNENSHTLAWSSSSRHM